MVRRFGYWRDPVIRKHEWNKKRPFYESLIKSLEPRKKPRKRKGRILKNGRWVRVESKMDHIRQRVELAIERIRELRKEHPALGIVEHEFKEILLLIKEIKS